MADINSTALGYELTILVYLACQSLLLFVVWLFGYLGGRRGAARWARIAFALLLILSLVVCGLALRECSACRDYVLSKQDDDPIAFTKLQGTLQFAWQCTIGSVAILFATLIGGLLIRWFACSRGEPQFEVDGEE